MRAELIETTASFTILAVSYLGRLHRERCVNPERVILRYADVGGRPRSHSVLCLAHTRVKVARDR